MSQHAVLRSEHLAPQREGAEQRRGCLEAGLLRQLVHERRRSLQVRRTRRAHSESGFRVPGPHWLSSQQVDIQLSAYRAAINRPLSAVAARALALIRCPAGVVGVVYRRWIHFPHLQVHMAGALPLIVAGFSIS